LQLKLALAASFCLLYSIFGQKRWEMTRAIENIYKWDASREATSASCSSSATFYFSSSSDSISMITAGYEAIIWLGYVC
jgi:hypothetical protein